MKLISVALVISILHEKLCFKYLKGNGVPITGHEGPRKCGFKGPHIHRHGRDRVACPAFGRLYLRYSFYSRLSRPQEQSGYEGKKKNFHPLRHPRSNMDPPARGLPPCRLSYNLSYNI